MLEAPEMTDERQPIQLVSEQSQFQEDVRQILENAKAVGMVDVIIVGTLPEGQYFATVSDSMSYAMQIGYLERAKHLILEGWTEKD
jgi:hypothetical protein